MTEPSQPSGPPANPLYRQQALQAMESHEDIERLLPVTSWRGWLVAVAAVLMIGAALLYAATDTRQVTVTGSGRIADGLGVRLVSSTVAGQISSFEVEPGDTVQAGQVVAYVVNGDARVPQRTENAGTVIASIWRPGDPVKVGDWLMEIAATQSDGRLALIAVNVDEGQRLTEGQSATVTVTGSWHEKQGRVVAGTVAGHTDPLRAVEVQIGLGLIEPPADKQIVAAIKLDEPIESGSEVSATVVVSERNLLQQLLGLS